jgi:phosphohistidine phosphatase SixA
VARREVPNPLFVVVMRHGPAEARDPARWPDDAKRPLRRKGVSQTRRAARGLAIHLDRVDRVATSTAVRARRTAEILRGELDSEPPIETWAELATGERAPPILERLAAAARPRETVVLVGHEPTLAEFVGLALVGEGLPVVRLTKAGAVLLEFPAAVRPGAARLVWALTRKQLAAARG